MTLQEIRLLQAFSAWATNRVFTALESLPLEQYHRDMKTSHGSIHGTLVHLVGAEKIWLARWENRKEPFLTSAEVPTREELFALWERVGFAAAQFLGTMSDARLQQTFVMRTVRGDQFEHTFQQALQHVVDHSTYHRGQVIAMMRQLGVEPPSTGLIQFYRETGKK